MKWIRCMWDRYSSWPFVVHMLCLAAIIFVSAYEWVFVLLGFDHDYSTSSSVFLWWFPSARAINITAAPHMWLLSGFVYCDFHMPPMRWIYYFWRAPCISTQAQVGISSCLIFLVIFDHGSSIPVYGFNASGFSSLIKVFCLWDIGFYNLSWNEWDDEMNKMCMFSCIE